MCPATAPTQLATGWLLGVSDQMPWARQQIKSISNPENSQPWYEFDLGEEADSVTIVTDNDAGLEADMAGGRLDLRHVNPSEPFRIAITEDGEFIGYQMGNEAPPLRTHLSPPTTVQDLTLYEFVE